MRKTTPPMPPRSDTSALWYRYSGSQQPTHNTPATPLNIEQQKDSSQKTMHKVTKHIEAGNTHLHKHPHSDTVQNDIEYSNNQEDPA